MTMRKTILSSLAATVVLAGCGDNPSSPDPGGPLATVTVVLPSNVVVAGRTMQLAVEGRTASGAAVSVPQAAWSTSDAAVAQVSAAGVLTALARGTVTVRAVAEGKEASAEVAVAPGAVPLLRRPFTADHPLLNAFDHDIPNPLFRAGAITDWRGTVLSGLEGHNGYDWVMPVGTPIHAAADGTVSFAGGEQPWFCALLGKTVSGLYVNLVHTMPGGERILTTYVHLNRIDVQAGQQVAAGQQIGVSGSTGCSTLPHLHFTVVREFYTRTGSPNGGVTDPSGWTGTAADPWLMASNGAASSRLWVPGAEPPLITSSNTAASRAQAHSPALDQSIPAPRLPAPARP